MTDLRMNGEDYMLKNCDSQYCRRYKALPSLSDRSNKVMQPTQDINIKSFLSLSCNIFSLAVVSCGILHCCLSDQKCPALVLQYMLACVLFDGCVLHEPGDTWQWQSWRRAGQAKVTSHHYLCLLHHPWIFNGWWDWSWKQKKIILTKAWILFITVN